jgi:hypothetical protein
VSILHDGTADVIVLGRGALANQIWPRLVRNYLGFGELDPTVFSPLADVMDCELEDQA